MIKKIYLFVNYVLLFIIALVVIFVAIASHPQSLEYFGDKFLKKSGVNYSKIEGSLLEGITLSDVNYSDAIFMKTLQIRYDLALLVKPSPKIKKISITGVSIYPENFASKDEKSEFFLPSFEISELILEKTQIILDKQTFSFDLNASGLSYDEQLNVKKLSMLLETPYAKAKIEGKIKSNRLIAKSFITPEKSITSEYLGFLEGLPQSYTLDLDASLESLCINTQLNTLRLSADKNLTLQNIALDLRYFIKENSFNLDTSYSLSYSEFEANVEQKALFTPSGVYSTELNATLTKQPFELPFKALHAKISGDTQNMRATLQAGPLEFTMLGKEYKEFVIDAKSDRLALSFIPILPELLKKNVLSLKADAILDLSPFSLKGSLLLEGKFSKITTSFEIDEKSKLLQATLYPKSESEIFKSYPIEKFSPLKLVYYKSDKTELFNADANMAGLTLFKKGKEINGWGNIGSSYFETEKNLLYGQEEVTFLAKIPSIKKLLEEFTAKNSSDTLLIDGEADIKATLSFSQKISLTSSLHMPWLMVKVDEKTSYSAQNIYIKSTLYENKIQIDEYTMRALEHDIYSKRASQISFKQNATIELKEFWIYDTLLLNGSYNLAKEQGKLRLRSNRFNYKGEEGNVTVKADIKASFESNSTQKIEGEVTLIDGVISYEPSSDYTLSDDIIIIQDIRPPTKVKRSINIQINSLKPIAYKTENIDILVTPDLLVSQKPDSPLSISGMLRIEEGTVTGEGKEFEFEKSEIYFKGSHPINPSLNLNLHYYTLDNTDIKIFITNTLALPVIILSSTPQMSQNDIMSYILFGEAASADFDSSGEGSNKLAVNSLLLATGLKQIFNDTAGIKLDTLNIITNKEGTLGYEIGTRFNKQIRIVYRNDTISSVILQYSLSKSIRLDVDVRETGQGVTILYVKDF